jgi:hypothetical protein
MGDRFLVDFGRHSHLTDTPKTLEVVLSSLSSPSSGWTVIVPQATIEHARTMHSGTLENNLPLDESFSYPPSPLIEEEQGSLGFGRLLMIGTILGSLLVFTGWQVADSHAPAAPEEVTVASGVQTMSAAELIQSIKVNNKTAYWLNAKPGDSYSDNSSTEGVDQISYRPEGSNISNLNQYDVMIGTYRDFSTYDAQPHLLLGANGRTVTLSNGATLTYNQMSPERALVAFPDQAEIVVINYPTTQTVPTLINDAENLVQIK